MLPKFLKKIFKRPSSNLPAVNQSLKNQKKESFIKKGFTYIGGAAAATAVSAGRMVGVVGDGVFVVPKLFKFFGGAEDSGIAIGTSIGIAAATATVNGFTRVPKIYDQFLPKAHTTINEPEIPLGRAGKSIYLILKMLNYGSSVFVGLASYLNTISLIEFVAKHAFDANPHQGEAEIATQALALFMALCAFSNNLIYTSKKANKTARFVASQIEKLDFHTDHYAKIAMSISIAGSIAVPFTAFFRTENALSKIPFIHLSIGSMGNIILSSISICTATASQLLSQTPAVYEAFTKTKDQYQPFMTEKSIKGFIYVAGLGDAAGTFISNFVGTSNTIGTAMLKIDPHNPYIITFAAVNASTNAFVYYFFSTHSGINDTFKLAHKAQGHLPIKHGEYHLLPTSSHEFDLEEQNTIQRIDDNNLNIEEISDDEMPDPRAQSDAVDIPRVYSNDSVRSMTLFSINNTDNTLLNTKQNACSF